MKTPQYKQVKDARPQLSQMLKNVGKGPSSYIIGIRNEPHAVLVDIHTAEKYLPAVYTLQNGLKEKPPSGEKFVKFVKKWQEANPKKSNAKAENISENHDKYIYKT